MPWTSRSHHLAGLVALLVMGLLGACESEQAQLLVLVNSDLTVPSELASVRLIVDDDVRTVSTAEQGIPFSFRVTPSGEQLDQTVAIRVEGLDPSGAVVVVASARVGFVAKQTRLLTLLLARQCALSLLQCEAALTCRDGACMSPDVDVSTLPKVKPRHERDGVGPLPDSCARGCRHDAGPELDAAVPDASAVVADAQTKSDLTLTTDASLARRCDYGLFGDSAYAQTRWTDGTSCSVIDYSGEWGIYAPSTDQNMLAGLRYLRLATSSGADAIGVGVTQIDGGLYAVSQPAGSPQVIEQSPPLEGLLASSILQTDQTVQFVIEDPVVDPVAFSDSVLEMLERQRAAGLIHTCRPAFVQANGYYPFKMLVELRKKLFADERWQPLRELVHLGRKVYGQAIPGEILDAVDEKLEFIVFESYRSNLFDAVSYAQSQGLKVVIDNMYDPRMTANLCGVSAGLQTLIKTNRKDSEKWLDEQRRVVETAMPLAVLDARELAAGTRELRYRGIPEPLDRRVAIGDGAQLPDVIGPDPTVGRHTSALRFDASKKQSLALHNAFNANLDDMALDNPYARFTLAVSVRFARTELQPGETMAIVSKRDASTGWSLELTNQGSGTNLRFAYNAQGIVDHLPHLWEVNLPAVTAKLNQNESFFVFAEYFGNGLAITTGAQDKSYYFPDLQGSQLLSNALPVTLGGEPNNTQSHFFDGEIQLVRVVSTRY